LEHQRRPGISAELNCIFIEQHQARFDWLVDELKRVEQPMNVHVYPVRGDFSECARRDPGREYPAQERVFEKRRCDG
jgi:hypothetical protein